MPGEQTRAGLARSRRGFLKAAALGSAAAVVAPGLRRDRDRPAGGWGPA